MFIHYFLHQWTDDPVQRNQMHPNVINNDDNRHTNEEEIWKKKIQFKFIEIQLIWCIWSILFFSLLFVIVSSLRSSFDSMCSIHVVSGLNTQSIDFRQRWYQAVLTEQPSAFSVCIYLSISLTEDLVSRWIVCSQFATKNRISRKMISES